MPREPSAYEILGLPRSATTSQIRARYRQLARRYQVARTTEQIFEEDKFLQRVRAYLVLDSPSRREYDRELRLAKRTGVPLPDLLSPMSPTDRVLLAAEVAFVRGAAQEATNLVRAILDKSQHNARGWALLGEILISQAKYDEAVSVLNFAIQFDPNTQRYWNLLNEASALREGRAAPRPVVEPTTEWERPAYVWALAAGALAVVIFSMLFVHAKTNSTVSWYFYDIEIPWLPIVVGVVDGLVVGLVLAIGNLLDRFDDELIHYQVWYEIAGGSNLSLVPLGLLLIPTGLICFWLAFGFYAIIAYMNERLSPSVSLVIAATAVVTAALTVLAPSGRWAVLVLAGNATFGGAILGWFLGSLRRVVWRKVDPATAGPHGSEMTP